MAWTTKQFVIAVILIFTGSINTISTKWADFLEARGADDKELRKFDHPFVQAWCMFFGEFLCLLCFKLLFCYFTRKQDGTVEEHSLTKGNREFNPLIFLPPAMCDMIGTSVMYIGLNMTYPSSFQMLRGSVIVFVALLSVAFLQRTITSRMWIGISFIISGLVIVGFSDFLINSNVNANSVKADTNALITGDLLIVTAQIIVAVQMVYEEKFVNDKDIPPLQAVGWEGTFGMIVISILLLPFYYIHVPSYISNSPNGVLEDLPDALAQMANNRLIIFAIIGTIISIAFFNFAGITVTKEMSATTRMVLDSVRILVIYLFSLGAGWQYFHPLQILGFVLLIIGMATYNNLMPSPCAMREMLCVRKEVVENLVQDQE